MGDVVRLKRKPRPLKATYDPHAPYVVEREDQDSGAIYYIVYDYRPDSYRYVCMTDDDFGTNPSAKRDAYLIARGLNLLVQYGLEGTDPKLDPRQSRMGMRVRPSKEFVKQFPQSVTGEGTVTGLGKDGVCLRVKWDEYAHAKLIHPDLLDFIE